MAAPSYTTDLSGQTLTSADAITGFGEPTATGWTAGAANPQNQTECFIQGNASVSKTYNATGVGGMAFNNGSGVTIPTDGAFTCWGYWASPNALDTEANGGLRLIIGNSLADFYGYIVGGPNTNYQYGGWLNFAINPTVTPDYTAGSPTGTWQYFGFIVKALAAISKGEPYAVDAMRYGRCEARIAGGETSNYATFAGFATQNDNSSNRWGLIQGVAGGFLWKGLMTLGYGSAVDFRDANAMVLIENTNRVTANFNKIEIRQSGSRVDWTSISFLALGTVAKGNFEVVDDCDVNISNCVFTGMGTFIFKASSAVLDSTFRRCGLITANGASFLGTLFEGYEGSSDSSYLVWDVNTDPDNYLSGCTFVKGAASTHAITFGTNLTLSSYTIHNATFTGYNASDGQTDSAIYVARTNGSVTINLINCSGNLKYKSAGATVTIVTSAVTVKQTVKGLDTGNAINGARVRLMRVLDDSVVLAGTTDVNGVLQDTGYSYTGDEAVYGWVRYASAPPYYKEAALSGSIGENGYDNTVLMIPDQ